MDKEQFVAAEPGSWWLLERDVDYRIETSRRDLGTSFGWGDPLWYAERGKLEELYAFIEGHNAQLLYELDRATDDESRKRWLDSVVDLKKPAEAGRGETGNAPAVAGAAASAEPVRRSAFGSSEQTTAPASAEPQRRSAFASRSQADPQSSTTDTGASEQPVGASLTEEQVKERLNESVKVVMSDLSTDGLSTLAGELGVSPEELEAVVHDPDFERLVADEAAKLATGGA